MQTSIAGIGLETCLMIGRCNLCNAPPWHASACQHATTQRFHSALLTTAQEIEAGKQSLSARPLMADLDMYLKVVTVVEDLQDSERACQDTSLAMDDTYGNGPQCQHETPVLNIYVSTSRQVHATMTHMLLQSFWVQLQSVEVFAAREAIMTRHEGTAELPQVHRTAKWQRFQEASRLMHPTRLESLPVRMV